MLIGLSGTKGSGKDTVFLRSVAMAERMGLPKPERLAFADPLKESASKLLGIPVEDLDKWKNDDPSSTGHLTILGRPMSIRLFLQRYGTEAHRDVFGQDFWIDATLPMNFIHQGRLVFVTDVRFDNEARRVKSVGGLNYSIVARQVDEGDTHASEMGISSKLVDQKIINTSFDDGFSFLDQQVRAMLADFDEDDYENPFDQSEFGIPNNLSIVDAGE